MPRPEMIETKHGTTRSALSMPDVRLKAPNTGQLIVCLILGKGIEVHVYDRCYPAFVHDEVYLRMVWI